MRWSKYIENADDFQPQFQWVFFIYINDLNCAITYFLVHPFSGDVNVLNYNNSVKRMNIQVNRDLENLTNCLNANKIFLDFSKTAVVLFKSLRKITDLSLKLTLLWKNNLPY